MCDGCVNTWTCTVQQQRTAVVRMLTLGHYTTNDRSWSRVLSRLDISVIHAFFTTMRLHQASDVSTQPRKRLPSRESIRLGFKSTRPKLEREQVNHPISQKRDSTNQLLTPKSPRSQVLLKGCMYAISEPDTPLPRQPTTGRHVQRVSRL
jgi:hypothetical protein